MARAKSCCPRCARRTSAERHARRPRASSGTPLAVADIAAAPRTPILTACLRDGWKSLLAVPLTRDDRILGALVVRRRTHGRLLRRRSRSCWRRSQVSRRWRFTTHASSDELERQAAELEGWNRELEGRVAEQVAEIERMARLKRFLPPQLAELVVSSGDESFLESHRREITVVFCDLRGFTAFAETAEPEVTMTVLREYHAALGDLVHPLRGDARAVHRRRADGVLQRSRALSRPGRARGADGGRDARPRRRARRAAGAAAGTTSASRVGIAQGYATLGRVGFEGRFDYAAIGTVTNLAARLCDAADDGQILVSQRVYAGSRIWSPRARCGSSSSRGSRVAQRVRDRRAQLIGRSRTSPGPASGKAGSRFGDQGGSPMAGRSERDVCGASRSRHRATRRAPARDDAEVERRSAALSCVQLDSISTVERSHRLALGPRRRLPAETRLAAALGRAGSSSTGRTRPACSRSSCGRSAGRRWRTAAAPWYGAVERSIRTWPRRSSARSGRAARSPRAISRAPPGRDVELEAREGDAGRLWNRGELVDPASARGSSGVRPRRARDPRELLEAPARPRRSGSARWRSGPFARGAR